MTNTENYNLNLPDADDFYNIEDINENMETIDAAMFSLEENIGQTSEKIGASADTGTETVMAKLNSVISTLGAGMTAVKNVQFGKINAGTSSSGCHTTFKLSTASSAKYAHYIDVTISQVADINKCQVKVGAYYSFASTTDTASNVGYVGLLTSKTNLRIYIGSTSASDGTSSSKGGIVWEVTEFN